MSKNVTCDKCNKQIKEIKTLTLQSKDYDLCIDCFGRIDKWLNAKEVKSDNLGMFS